MALGHFPELTHNDTQAPGTLRGSQCGEAKPRVRCLGPAATQGWGEGVGLLPLQGLPVSLGTPTQST